MGIVRELINLFHIDLKEEGSPVVKSMRDLPESITKSPIGLAAFSIIKKMETEGLLHLMGNSGKPIIDNKYANLEYDKRFLDYGAYDNQILGFHYIREEFRNSVFPVIVIKTDGDSSIGTSFLLEDDLIITARHCIDKQKNVFIPDDNNQPIELEYIIAPTDSELDIAYIKLKKPIKRKAFLSMPGNILDEVLTLGYPPIPTFDAIQVADLASINTKIKSSSGRLTGKGHDYMYSNEYLLLNARVKGGNSGGPVINKFGLVVCMIVRLPTENGDIDKLGYGVAIPIETITNIYNSRNDGKSVKNIDFKMEREGFSTI